jgi:hypothetical protein
MSEAKDIEAKVILFDVDGEKDMRIEYPELMKIKEFSELKNKKEVRLCWLIGNRTSPIAGLEATQRIKKAFDIVYTSGVIPSELLPMSKSAKREDVPDRILSAIERMSWFDTDGRLKAKLVTQYMFDMLVQMVMVDDSTFKLMDMDDKKKLAELMIKVNSELPGIIKTLEEGYGVKIVERKTGKKLLTDINKLKG